MTIVVTGAAGFIGYHVAEALLARGEDVIGIDIVNDYYSVVLKEARLDRLAKSGRFRFIKLDLGDAEATAKTFAELSGVTGIVHLAAQAGVRYSLENPYSYVHSNLMGQVTICEAARRLPDLKHLVYASSSSVYGGNEEMPFSIEDRVDRPMSLYAATKRADELIAHSYANMFGLPSTGLRFFTVYGPWGRPDMAAYIFAESIVAGKPIHVFNGGQMQRDFTYIDDIVKGVIAALDKEPEPNDIGVRHAVYNLGNNRSEKLTHFIELIEKELGRKAEMIMEPMQTGDVRATLADIEASRRDLGYEPATPLDVGMPRFIEWFKQYNKVN